MRLIIWHTVAGKSVQPPPGLSDQYLNSGTGYSCSFNHRQATPTTFLNSL